MTIALADNEYSEQERNLFDQLSHSEDLEDGASFSDYEPISAAELATGLGKDPAIAQNFLRMAVMMALADGHYTESEDQMIQGFSKALHQEITAINELRQKLQAATPHDEHHPDLLNPVKEWLDHLEIHDAKLANLICKVIPAQCPFERDVKLFGRKIMHIPAMCEINPLYDQLVGLRFRSLNFLADKGEDVSKYCQ
jgi:tellurite resistance protein